MRYKDDGKDEERKSEKSKIRLTTKWDSIDMDNADFAMPSSTSAKFSDTKQAVTLKEEPAEDEETRKRLRQLEVISEPP